MLGQDVSNCKPPGLPEASVANFNRLPLKLHPANLRRDVARSLQEGLEVHYRRFNGCQLFNRAAMIPLQHSQPKAQVSNEHPPFVKRSDWTLTISKQLLSGSMQISQLH